MVFFIWPICSARFARRLNMLRSSLSNRSISSLKLSMLTGWLELFPDIGILFPVGIVPFRVIDVVVQAA